MKTSEAEREYARLIQNLTKLVPHLMFVDGKMIQNPVNLVVALLENYDPVWLSSFTHREGPQEEEFSDTERIIQMLMELTSRLDTATELEVKFAENMDLVIAKLANFESRIGTLEQPRQLVPGRGLRRPNQPESDVKLHEERLARLQKLGQDAIDGVTTMAKGIGGNSEVASKVTEHLSESGGPLDFSKLTEVKAQESKVSLPEPKSEWVLREGVPFRTVSDQTCVVDKLEKIFTDKGDDYRIHFVDGASRVRISDLENFHKMWQPKPLDSA